jgi:hypothetical protein
MREALWFGQDSKQLKQVYSAGTFDNMTLYNLKIVNLAFKNVFKSVFMDVLQSWKRKER